MSENQTIQVEKLEVEPGQSIDFDRVLLIGDKGDIRVGSPYLDGTKVSGEVIEQGRGEKVRIIKFRRRKHSQKQMGHRQSYTAVKITAIQA